MNKRCVYIAGDWTGDAKLIQAIRAYNNNSYYNLSFLDAHDLIQARDTSLNCSIKKSLAVRMERARTFVLIVGEKTLNLRSGNCYLCEKYMHVIGCIAGQPISNKSYVEYECDKAVRDGMRIVVVYNSVVVVKAKCPDSLRNKGKHIAGYTIDSIGRRCLNYSEITSAIMA